uniref:Uncharacterized protein n=1 Tax=virus sp. ctkyY8 TaxID=2827995 RepID=A0A8S5RDY9_9VIRU|nr:MAG TPA: hypothetical protein [virus sp. ctkyY8]
MKTNINIEDLERKNNIILENIERFSKYFPNIENCALVLADKIEEAKFEQEMAHCNQQGF